MKIAAAIFWIAILSSSVRIGRAESPGSQPDIDAAGESEAVTSDESAARSAYIQGDRLFLEGDFAGAATAFEKAYALSGRMEMLFNLANAHERLGNHVQASSALRGYIPHAPPMQRPALERRLLRLIELSREDEARHDKELADTLAAKKLAEAEAEAARRHPPLPPPQTTKKQISWDRAAGIGLVILGGSALVAGSAFALSVAGARQDLNEDCLDGQSGRLCPASSQTALNRDKSFSIAADISFVAAAALTAGGLFLILKKGDKASIHAGVSPQNIFVQGTF